MSLWNRIKQAVNNWTARLEKANSETFGKGTLDCCKLNHDDAGKKSGS